jgi:hypothetical protein
VHDGDLLVVHAAWNRSLGVEADGYEDLEYRYTSERLRLADGVSLGEAERADATLSVSGSESVDLEDRATLVLKYGAFTAVGITPQGDRALVGTESGALLEFTEHDNLPKA